MNEKNQERDCLDIGADRNRIGEAGANDRRAKEVSAMTERAWFWYAGRNDEACQVGPCASREEAIAEALSSNVYQEIDPDTENPNWRVSIYTVEATKHRLEDVRIFDADRILEHLSEDVYDDWLDPDGDGRLFDYTPEQERDLCMRLTAALHAWSRHHELRPNSFMFRDMRNEEWIVLPHPDDKAVGPPSLEKSE